MKEQTASPTLPQRLLSLLRSPGLGRHLVIALAVLSGLSAVATYVAITRSDTPAGPSAGSVLVLILVNLSLLLALLFVIVRRVVGLVFALRQGSVGSRLQTRIVGMFMLVAILPAITVSVASVYFFNFGVKAWFNERVTVALDHSLSIAQAYLAEHKEMIRADILAMANDLNREAPRLAVNPRLRARIVNAQASLRSLPEAILFQRDKALAKTPFTFSLAFEALPPDALHRASQGEVVLLTEDQEDRVRALIKLDGWIDTYLLVGRYVDAEILEHVETTQGAVAEYDRLRAQLPNLQITFLMVYAAATFLLLLVVIWIGLGFAAQLVQPITRLIQATDRIKGGDFAIHVDEGPSGDEIGTLARAFNRMASQLAGQRKELVRANEQLDRRRRFSEMVLSGVSAGVIGLDRDRLVTHVNRSAAALLNLDSIAALGQPLEEVMPESACVLDEFHALTDRSVLQRNLTLQRKNRVFELHLRAGLERLENGEIHGYVITFDDMTELVAAQRHAAWGDVARRVAHEIKNPLTPIQLSSQRLWRKYGHHRPPEEQDAFHRYTDTITRHADDIRRMVEEFVASARMPAPEFHLEDLLSILQDVLFSERFSHPDISYLLDCKEENLPVLADSSQLRRAFMNILKNAAEAIMESKKHAGLEEKESSGHISLSIKTYSQQAMIRIEDNGPGFPETLLSRLTEPYVTTRSNGMGLGLSIARKIIEEHRGTLELLNPPEGGARIDIHLPLAPKEQSDAA